MISNPWRQTSVGIHRHSSGKSASKFDRKNVWIELYMNMFYLWIVWPYDNMRRHECVANVQKRRRHVGWLQYATSVVDTSVECWMVVPLSLSLSSKKCGMTPHELVTHECSGRRNPWFLQGVTPRIPSLVNRPLRTPTSVCCLFFLLCSALECSLHWYAWC